MHADGCREALVSYVRTWLFLGMCIITSVCFVLQAIILILLRYLQTSIALAIKKGDPTADSLAYILSICLPTDDMTEDKCLRPVSASMAPSVAPSFASAPPTTTSRTLEQAAATLAAVGQPVTASQSVLADGAAGDDALTLCRRVPVGTVNNSARGDLQPASVVPSNRSSVISMSAPHGRRSPATPYLPT